MVSEKCWLRRISFNIPGFNIPGEPYRFPC